MIALLLLLQTTALPDCEDVESGKIVSDMCTPSGTVTLKGSDPEAAIEEFIAVCVRPDGDAQKTADAARASKLRYKSTTLDQFSQRWESKQALISLEEPKVHQDLGNGLPQCDFIFAVGPAWTNQQFLSHLKIAVARTTDVPLWDGTPEAAAELGGTSDFLEWVSDRPDIRNRVTVWATGSANQAVHLVFEKWSQTGLVANRIRYAKSEAKPQ